MIGAPSTPLALQEFSLISFDKSGNRQLLPPGLGDLPLYVDDDGYSSVTGSIEFTLLSPHTALAAVSHDNQSTFHPLITDIPGFSGENPQGTPDPNLGYLNVDTISRLVTSPPLLDSFWAFISNSSTVGHGHVLREEVTTAASLVAPGNPHSQRSRR